MRRLSGFACVLALALSLSGLSATEGAAAGPKIELKAITTWVVSTSNNDHYKEFIKTVNEKAKGELGIKLIGGPEVVAPFDQLKALQKGVVDMVHGSQAYYAGMVPEGTITELCKPKLEVKAFRESGIWDDYVNAYLEKANARFLGNTHIGMPFYIMTAKPVTKLDDVRGMKLRGIGGLADVLLGELGASVVRISSPETYEGLQRGVVDGAIRNSISLVDLKEFEVMKYILYPPIYSAYGGVWISEEKWKTIPKHLQTIILDTIKKVEADAREYFDKMDKDNIKLVQEKHGMKLVQLSDKDVARVGEIRSGAAIKDWINKKAPKYGPSIYAKMAPYMK
jgi:TRAP-type C4-dicarboxylate transport system substrate-binding protein